MMRKMVYIFGLLCCVACNKFESKSQDAFTATESLKVEENALIEDADDELDMTTTAFTLEDINEEIQEKLQANYEAQILATKHPEFAEAIKEQLTSSTKFSTAISDSIQTLTIENLEYLGEMETLNDSIAIQDIKYSTLINGTHQQKDSARVVIKRTMIVIDDAVKVNTSFVFERLHL
jgi:hypothetical protein